MTPSTTAATLPRREHDTVATRQKSPPGPEIGPPRIAAGAEAPTALPIACSAPKPAALSHAPATAVLSQEALHELQDTTPAISSAGHYARMVQETALLRQLIFAAGDIAELAYSEPDDVIKALDMAESKVFHVAEQRTSATTRTIGTSGSFGFASR